MQFLYQGTDISADISIHSVAYNDMSNAKADRLEIVFNDVDREWTTWTPQVGDECRLVEGTLDTGVLFINHTRETNGKFFLGAVSIPPDSKTGKERAFEDVRLLSIASELAAKHGFALSTHGVGNPHYERLRQSGESDFSFLDQLCRQEGYAFKAYDKKAILYDANQIENRAPVDALELTRYDSYSISYSDRWHCGACEVMTHDGAARFDAPDAKNERVLKYRDVMASGIAEGLRFARGLLRDHNSKASRAIIPIDLRTDLTAGSVIALTGEGVSAGNYFIFRAEHNFTTLQSRLYARKPLSY